jgi:hypothetical protein
MSVTEAGARSFLGRTPYLRDGRCEHHYFIEFTDPLHEFIDTGALDDINVMVVTLNFDRYCEICLMQNLEARQ